MINIIDNSKSISKYLELFNKDINDTDNEIKHFSSYHLLSFVIIFCYLCYLVYP